MLSAQTAQAFRSLCATSSCRRGTRVIGRSFVTASHTAGAVVNDAQNIDLPPPSHWRSMFPVRGDVAKRFSINNQDTANALADAFVPEGSKDKIIIEGLPGPGSLTRALLALPKSRISKLIVLEPHGPYLRFLKPLEQLDPRIIVREYHPKDWVTYRKLREEGLLDDVQTIPWDGGVHPQLHFMMHVSMSVHGEQLLSQLLRAIPDGQWLYQHGRVPMSVLLLNRMWDRIKAEEGSNIRCKVSVMAQAAAECKEVIPCESLSPFSSHFHPAIREAELRTNQVLDARRFGNPVSALSIVPYHNRFIKPGDLDFWDYCVRKLFVKKATPLSTAISSLGPGASVLLPKLEGKIPLKAMVRDLTVEQWECIIEAFKAWPFRPQDLGIITFFETSHANR